MGHGGSTGERVLQPKLARKNATHICKKIALNGSGFRVCFLSPDLHGVAVNHVLQDSAKSAA